MESFKEKGAFRKVPKYHAALKKALLKLRKDVNTVSEDQRQALHAG